MSILEVAGFCLLLVLVMIAVARALPPEPRDRSLGSMVRQNRDRKFKKIKGAPTMYRKSEESRPNVYQIVTDRVASLIERGTVPWKQPWTGVLPTNYDSGKQYKGINILALTAFGRDYDSPYWLTYNQTRSRTP